MAFTYVVDIIIILVQGHTTSYGMFTLMYSLALTVPLLLKIQIDLQLLGCNMPIHKLL